MQRTFSADHLNAVANDPAVRQWLGGEGELDFHGAISNPANVALTTEHGGYFLERYEPGLYEAHSLFMPDGRGREAITAMRDGFRYMFTRTDAIEILTKVPSNNLAAKGLAFLAGFEHRFSRQGAWPTQSGLVDVDYYALHISRWAQMDKGCLEAGEVFHAQIETEKLKCGSALAIHPDDKAHDHAAGAAMLMALAGQGIKACLFYNRWAKLAGYATISLLSEQPVVIDVRDAIVSAGPKGMEILQCR